MELHEYPYAIAELQSEYANLSSRVFDNSKDPNLMLKIKTCSIEIEKLKALFLLAKLDRQEQILRLMIEAKVAGLEVEDATSTD